MKRLLGIAAAASALVLAVSGCANYSSDSSDSTTASDGKVALVQDGKLTVCTHLAYKPFQFKDDKNVTVGFDVDMMDLVAKDLGVKQEIVDIEFEQITSGAVFAADKCDVGAAAITITDARKKETLFSDPYFTATQALLVKDGSIKDLSDLKGKVLAVQSGTTGLDYAEKNKDKYGYTTKVFDDMPSSANAVLAGTVDAAINDNGVMLSFAKDNPTTQVTSEFETGEHYGFNMGKDNTAIQAEVNKVIAAAKEDGTYSEIYKKWFGVEAPE